LALAIAAAAMAMTGFFVIPPIARHVAETRLGELLGRDVKIDKLRVNPFALSVTVDGFRILEPDRRRTFAGFSRLYVNAQLSSLVRGAPVIREIRLESPRVRGRLQLLGHRGQAVGAPEDRRDPCGPRARVRAGLAAIRAREHSHPRRRGELRG
jgi:hypothetical protein